MNRIPVALVGASGYTGAELIRYLMGHPVFELTEFYGDSSAGKRIGQVHPAFDGYVDAEIRPMAAIGTTHAETVILALPHGKSAAVVDGLLQAGYAGKVVDLGNDFRPPNEAPAPFAYGLTEWMGVAWEEVRFLANPGCFATALQLVMLPMLKAGYRGRFHATLITGSSGSGATPSATTHYSSRFGNLNAYKVFGHQHEAEVAAHCATMAGRVPDLSFVPVSGPFVRGIWGTLLLDAGAPDPARVFAEAYARAPLVRLRDRLPELKPVVGTAFADLGWVRQGDHTVVGVAIDNLGKGAAGQAVQNLNRMYGLAETTGLLIPPIIL